jgi:DNA-binding Xre family transcriptional regulator
MDMRLRLPELLEERDLTAYEVAKKSGGRISPSTLYRLSRDKGYVESFSSSLLEALCDVLEVEPGELLEREAKRRKRS